MSKYEEWKGGWAALEIGHDILAGYVCDHSPGLLRVEVPEVEEQSAFTRFIASHAATTITPCSEEYVIHLIAVLKNAKREETGALLNARYLGAESQNEPDPEDIPF